MKSGYMEFSRTFYRIGVLVQGSPDQFQNRISNEFRGTMCNDSDCLDGLLYQKVSKVSSIRLIDISMSREFPMSLIKICCFVGNRQTEFDDKIKRSATGVFALSAL